MLPFRDAQWLVALALPPGDRLRLASGAQVAGDDSTTGALILARQKR
jgi:hypothetical protein